MPALTFQSLLIWALCPVMQLLCVYLLYNRKLLNQFKFLAGFLLLQTANNLIRFTVFRTCGQYSWEYYSVYWVGTALSDMVMIAVLYEIFCAAFKPFAGLQDLAKVVFKWAAGCILFIGFVVLMTTPEATSIRNHWVYVSVSSFERIVRVMACALLLFLFLGAQHLGISKRNRVFGFVLGFGVQAFLQLLVYSTLASSHVSKIPILTPLIPQIYFISLLIWVAYLIQPEPARESLHIPITSPLLRWNEVALAMGHSGGQVALMNSEPFMPSVERMVEQVMQKEMFVERRQQRVV
jgi:tetrahydromethanopterin S-methyltransferase subunit B